MNPRILVVGMGNDLLSDDGFGIVAIQRLMAQNVPEGVRLLEIGIAGIGLVQELLDAYDALIIIDAIDRGSAPGALHLLSVEVPDPALLTPAGRRDLMSDMHTTVPSRALTLARALDVLPQHVFILGCQPADMGLGMGLTPAVWRALDEAVERILELIETIRSSVGPSSDASRDAVLASAG